jgi:hypothetical protein
MKVWVFVEGSSDVKALSALWSDWKEKLRDEGWGIQIIPLENKSSYAILSKANLREVAEQCPAFRAMIDWIGDKTGVPGY